MSKGNVIGALRDRGGRLPALRVGAAALAVGLVLAGCGGDEEDQAPSGDDDPAAQEGGAGTLTGISPLTGEQIGANAPEGPVVVVKIDNTGAGSPQVGLSEADLVVEELVEGGSTRLASFFWTRTPDVVGPVRSMRGTDVGIVAPLGGVLVASGGAPPTIRQVAAEDILTVTEGGTGYYRDDARSAPYNLMMDLTELVPTLDGGAPAAPYLPFGAASDLPRGQAATDVDVTFSGGHTTSWSYQDGTGYVRDQSPATQGDDFVPDTVLALEVRVGDAGYLDPAGNPVPESQFYGEGAATVFHAGRAVEGTWSKRGPASALQLTTADGQTLIVPVGSTFVELVPTDTGSLDY